MNEVSEQAREAAGTAQEKMREQLDQRSSETGEKVAGTAQDLRSVGEELRKQGKDTPAKFADRAADKTERLGSYLKESDADKMLSDVEDFGRRQPLAVLAGGLVLGIAAARFLKASSRDRYRSRAAGEGRTRELGQPTTPEPRGVYADAPAATPAAAESSRQAPVPAGGAVGR
jgi:glucan phosphorylase